MNDTRYVPVNRDSTGNTPPGVTVRDRADSSEAIRAEVAQWPPLSGAQRERLAVLLSSATPKAVRHD